MDAAFLFQTCIKSKASDLHISPGQPPIIRLDGDLTPIKDTPKLDAAATKELILGVMNEDQRKQFATDLEIDFAIAVPGVANFRVNAFTQKDGTAAAFRLITEEIPGMEELHLPDTLKKLLDLPNGLILVTGPTGSGKSTTLAAMIDHINITQACHIITIEDPIEYIIHSKKSLVNQREVHRDTKDFNAALRSSLREDPDVILIGELRDLETIRLALTAAETGHLVFATLHTSSAPRTISRVVDVFPAAEKNIIRNMLSESLEAVICQTLVKKVGGGRVAAFEIMLGTTAIRNLIREDKVAQMYNTIQTSTGIGMASLDQFLQSLVTQGLITSAVAYERANNKTLFKP